ncbi:MAG: hypothetical protein GTO24_02320, partial [candidate division Zixibacteria bacterium]|nr:hypothetical protein [candidate division Zixibacteria bacterium]
LSIAREKAGLPEDAEVEIVTYPKRKLFFGLPGRSLLSLSPDVRSILEELDGRSLFGDDHILLLMPYLIDIK